MPLQRTPYRFSVKLPASREAAFRWATDYRPDDLELMGWVGRRKVSRLAKNLILLTDSVVTPKGRVTKVRLVHLLPEGYRWTNTHFGGPNRYSQFLYELVPAGRGACRLRFTGLQVDRVRHEVTPGSVARRARELVREDSRLWRRLAAVLRRESR